jgi:hypothetical protein
VELRQSNLLQSLNEVQKFIDEHAAELPGVGESGMKKKFDETLAELARLGETQTAAELAAMSATRRVNVITQDLIEHHMSHVANIAAISLPPGLELAPLALPSEFQRGERLAAKARGMATAAQKFESTFIDAGLPKDFIQRIREEASSLSALIVERKQSVAARGAATKLMRTNIREARKLVKVLNGFVKTAAKGNTELLLTWRILKRLRRPAVVTPVVQTTVPTPTGATA